MYQKTTYDENLRKICSIAKKERTGNAVYQDLPTNYGELHPIVKIHILDAIIKQASAVFGPYGGIYGELKAAEMMGGQEITDGGYEKSKDGHSFFNSLELGSKYAQTIMKSIQQMTKYVAGYDGDTSRDGTTSVAIVGCLTAKNLLLNRYNKSEIPSTIQNMIFDLLLYHGSSMIEKYKVPVYDKAQLKYLPNGFDRAFDAIKTTVDNHGLFTRAFGDLMREAEEKGYDLINAHLSTPNNVDGLANIEIKVNAGIRFRAANLDPKTAGGFYNHQSYTFVLDGYISPEHRDIYVYHLKNWLKHICSFRDANGLLFVPGRYDVPLIIVTRTPEYLEPVYKAISNDGIEVISNGTKHIIKPKFMLGNNTESLKVYFDDALDVFSETRIDLNRMNRYIRDNKHTSDEIDTTLGMAKPVKQKEIDISSLFPMVDKTGNFVIYVPQPTDVYDEGIPEDVEQEAKFTKLEKYEFNPMNVLLTSNYDGQSLSLVPSTEELIERANMKRESLLRQKETLSDLSMEEHMIPERLAFFSSMTIKPIITARSKDEYAQLFSVYEDALGVFQSVHKHGVMPGGNIFLLKHIDELYKSFKDDVNDRLRDVDPNKAIKYLEFADSVFEALIAGYFDAVRLLTKEDFDKVYDDLMNNPELREDTLMSYNIVIGKWDTNVVEASRTTADVFASAISMMKDMFQLKRIKLYTKNAEHTQVHLANKELTLGEEYKRFDEEIK